MRPAAVPRARRHAFGPLQWLAATAALIAVLPLAGIVAAALSGETADIAARDLVRYAETSALLAASVSGAVGLLGAIAAWLVVMHRFPGRDLFAWALALPLAAPAFALAYAYGDLFDVAGDLRVWMRAALGFDLPFGIRNVPGATFVLTCAFYPYVYLAMRAALVNQPVAALEAARTLGCSPREAMLRAALPLARPALAAGVALAAMETLADYGAVQFLSVQTLTTGVVRAWSVYGSTASAARFALPLLVAAALLLWIERLGRRGRSHEDGKAKWRPVPVTPLGGAKAVGAFLFCFFLLFFGLLLPAGWLLWSSLTVAPDWARLGDAAAHSVTLGLAGAVVTVGLATALALGSARLPAATRLAGLGYATPGAVMAIGLLAPATLIWRMTTGASGFAVGVGLLIYAYAARLMAAALEPVEAGLSRVAPNMVWAARTLGRGPARTAWSVQLPVARGALLTAGLLVFIDILKELPATLILRPFNFDTLAVIASNYALDERLARAGAPALLIIALALGPTIWLSRKIALSRPGAA